MNEIEQKTVLKFIRNFRLLIVCIKIIGSFVKHSPNYREHWCSLPLHPVWRREMVPDLAISRISSLSSLLLPCLAPFLSPWFLLQAASKSSHSWICGGQGLPPSVVTRPSAWLENYCCALAQSSHVQIWSQPQPSHVSLSTGKNRFGEEDEEEEDVFWVNN